MWGAGKPGAGGLAQPLLAGDREGEGGAAAAAARRAEAGGELEGLLSRSHSARSSALGSVVTARKRTHVGADRGTGLYQLEREALALPSLVQAGRCVGSVEGRGLWEYSWERLFDSPWRTLGASSCMRANKAQTTRREARLGIEKGTPRREESR